MPIVVLDDEDRNLWELLEVETEGGEEPECNCYFSGDQADASECDLHGGNR